MQELPHTSVILYVSSEKKIALTLSVNLNKVHDKSKQAAVLIDYRKILEKYSCLAQYCS